MINPDEGQQDRGRKRSFPASTLLIILFSLIAIVSTFLPSVSTAEVSAKTNGFFVIIAAFLFVCASLHVWQTRRNPEDVAAETISDAEVERILIALDEANQFFAGSLKTADMFRLVSSRMRDLLPFKTIVLFLLNETRTRLEVAEVDGVGFDAAVAEKCYTSKRVLLDRDLANKAGNHTRDRVRVSSTFVAIPLCRGNEVFGVLQLVLDAAYTPRDADRSLFEALGTRIAPLILSSIAYERSQANALTDSTTDLPNERAFYLVLENQIAEAQRKRYDRPLTLLAIDIKNFDEINQRHGHAAGERVLNFVAPIVKDNLRQMDFFARSINDEFLAVLPTASTEISHDIIARVHTGFFGRKLKVSDSDMVEIEIELNVGWAAFGNDGETSDSLLRTARLRKQQTKSSEPKKVLWFPQEFAH